MSNTRKLSVSDAERDFEGTFPGTSACDYRVDSESPPTVEDDSTDGTKNDTFIPVEHRPYKDNLPTPSEITAGLHGLGVVRQALELARRNRQQ